MIGMCLFWWLSYLFPSRKLGPFGLGLVAFALVGGWYVARIILYAEPKWLIPQQFRYLRGYLADRDDISSL